jgi:hypothetical protein
VYPASWFGGSTNSTVEIATHASASAFTAVEKRPRSQGPRSRQRPVRRA